MTITRRQKIAHKYYKAYAALCCSKNESDAMDNTTQAELRCLREIMHMKYKQYDPDNSFDVSVEYLK